MLTFVKVCFSLLVIVAACCTGVFIGYKYGYYDGTKQSRLIEANAQRYYVEAMAGKVPQYSPVQPAAATY